jgi:hypothetical protein
MKRAQTWNCDTTGSENVYYKSIEQSKYIISVYIKISLFNVCFFSVNNFNEFFNTENGDSGFLRNMGELLDTESHLIIFFTLKNGVFWDVTPCGSYKSGRFGRT